MSRYAVELSSSDDPEVDAELVRFEDELHTVEEIQAVCRHRLVLGLAYEADGTLRGVVERDGRWTPLTRGARR